MIRPALEAGRDVVADRFSDSSVAYQGAARGLGVGEVISLCDHATDGLWPDLTLLLRIDPEDSLGRAAGEDRFEAEGLILQQAVAMAYEEIAKIAADRVAVVDATGTRRGGPRAGAGRGRGAPGGAGVRRVRRCRYGIQANALGRA